MFELFQFFTCQVSYAEFLLEIDHTFLLDDTGVKDPLDEHQWSALNSALGVNFGHIQKIMFVIVMVLVIFI